MRILDHEHSRHPELVEQRHRDVPRMAAGLDGRCERPSHCRRDVGEGAERSRRREMLTGTVERTAPMARRETAHERRLADPRLATDENEPPTRVFGGGEASEKLLPLDEWGR